MNRYGLLTLICAALSSSGLHADQQPTERQQCPPACRIDIQVPEDTSRSPIASPVTLVVQADQAVELMSDRAVQVIFPEETPFMDHRDRPVYTFNLRSRRASSLRLREERGLCETEPGCKYIVIDRSAPGRPPLDPYIIIER